MKFGNEGTPAEGSNASPGGRRLPEGGTADGDIGGYQLGTTATMEAPR